MSKRIVVLGAGGFGREAIDVLKAVEKENPGSIVIDGVADSNPTEYSLAALRRHNIAFLGSIEAWFASGPTTEFVIAIGNPAIRSQIAQQAAGLGLRAATIVHPGAILGSHLSIGDGTIICAGVQVSSGVEIGSHVHLNPSATVGHDTQIGNFVSVNPGAVISGFVTLSQSSLVGANAVVLQGIVIGEGATVGAAACVTRDVQPGRTVKGVPAK